MSPDESVPNVNITRLREAVNGDGEIGQDGDKASAEMSSGDTGNTLRCPVNKFSWIATLRCGDTSIR